jgi:hypothetical protein
LEVFFPQMLRVMLVLAQPLNNMNRDPHIGQESHVSPLSGMDFLLSQPGCIFNCLPYILLIQVGIALQNLPNSRSMRDLIDDSRNWNPHPAYACTASHDLWIKADSIKHFHLQYWRQIEIPIPKKMTNKTANSSDHNGTQHGQQGWKARIRIWFAR